MTDTADFQAVPPHIKEAQDANQERDPKLSQMYRFTIDWTAPNGDSFTGTFAHKAPTVGDVIAIELDRAKRLGSADEERLSPRAVELMGMMAHMERTLLERPSWAKKLEEIPFAELFNLVASEVSTHIETFCVRQDGKKEG